MRKGNQPTISQPTSRDPNLNVLELLKPVSPVGECVFKHESVGAISHLNHNIVPQNSQKYYEIYYNSFKSFL